MNLAPLPEPILSAFERATTYLQLLCLREDEFQPLLFKNHNALAMLWAILPLLRHRGDEGKVSKQLS